MYWGSTVLPLEFYTKCCSQLLPTIGIFFTHFQGLLMGALVAAMAIGRGIAPLVGKLFCVMIQSQFFDLTFLWTSSFSSCFHLPSRWQAHVASHDHLCTLGVFGAAGVPGSLPHHETTKGLTRVFNVSRTESRWLPCIINPFQFGINACGCLTNKQVIHANK